MILNYKTLFLFGMIFLLTTVLFVGQFYDHHGDRSLFIKHRPTFHQMFHPEEDVYQEFIASRDLPRRHGILMLPSIMIQITIMLLVSGVFSLCKRKALSWLQLIGQFIFNFFITSVGVFSALYYENLMTSIIWLLVSVATNLITIIIIDRKQRSNTATGG